MLISAGRLSQLTLALAVALAISPSFAQSQASGVAGRLVDASGVPTADVEITVTHVQSGTIARTRTDAQGRYQVSGLRVGGPYTVAAAGLRSVDGVYLFLDRLEEVDFTTPRIADLDSVVVTAHPLLVGTGTSLNATQLAQLPSIDRSLTDYVRLDPRFAVTNRATNEISVGGQNPRYNEINLDGINVADTFGLETNNLPTPRQPFLMDTIESLSIDAVNYDASTPGTAGGEINAVTKSGTNEFHGSVFGTYRDHDFVRENRDGSNFSGFNKERAAGFTVGGPIVSDRLFFFLDFEDYKLESPGPSFGPVGSSASGIVNVTQAELDQIRGIAMTLRGFDPGTVGGTSDADTTAQQVGLKLDWNINNDHRLSYRHSMNDQSQANFPGFSPGSIAFDSYAYQREFDLDTDTLQVFSHWTDQVSTEASLSNRRYVAERVPASRLPAVAIQVRPGAIVFMGTEENSFLNRLETDTWNAAFAANLFMGSHSLKFGADYERNDIQNLYGRRINGTYGFYGIPYFAAGVSTPFRFSYPAGGDPMSMAADWTLSNVGVFAQDTWSVSDTLTLTLGLRYDESSVNRPPTYNAAASTAFGVDNRNTIEGQGLLQPRVAFRYSPTDNDATIVRGGVGLFRGAAPSVWLSNPYSNTGLNYTDYNFPIFFGGFNPDPDSQIDLIPAGNPGATQSIDLIDADLRQPSTWKANLAIDQKLAWGISGTAELVLTNVRDAIYYQNLNLGAATAIGQDGRSLFWNAAGLDPLNWNQGGFNAASVRARSAANPAYTDVLIARPTSKGESAQLSLTLQKPFNDSPWSWMAAYTYTDASEVSPLTSTNTLALWGNQNAFHPNEEISSRSLYEIRDRFIGVVSFQHDFIPNRPTTASLFYEGRSGRPYSYVFDNDANGDGRTGNDLLYIPTGPGDVVFGSPQEEAAFFAAVNGDDYLRSHAGQVATRNGAKSSFVNQFDLRISQQLPGFTPTHHSEIWLDVLNVGNLLNRSWGQIHDASSPGSIGVVEYGGVCGATANPACGAGDTGRYVYRYNGIDQLGIQDDRAVSRWSVQVGFRYAF